MKTIDPVLSTDPFTDRSARSGMVVATIPLKRGADANHLSVLYHLLYHPR